MKAACETKDTEDPSLKLVPEEPDVAENPQEAEPSQDEGQEKDETPDTTIRIVSPSIQVSAQASASAGTDGNFKFPLDFPQLGEIAKRFPSSTDISSASSAFASASASSSFNTVSFIYAAMLRFSYGKKSWQ